MNTFKPRRRVMLDLWLQADSRDEMMRALNQIILELSMGNLRGESVSGGVHSGYVMSINEDETITNESYHEALKHYLEPPSRAGAPTPKEGA